MSKFESKLDCTSGGWGYIDVRANRDGKFDILFQDRRMAKPMPTPEILRLMREQKRPACSPMPMLPREGIADHKTALLYASLYDLYFTAEIDGRIADYGEHFELVKSFWPEGWESDPAINPFKELPARQKSKRGRNKGEELDITTKAKDESGFALAADKPDYATTPPKPAQTPAKRPETTKEKPAVTQSARPVLPFGEQIF